MFDIKKFRNKVKEELPELHSKLESNNVDDEVLMKMVPAINRIIEDKNKGNDHTIEIVLNDSSFDLEVKPLTKKAQITDRVQAISKNYLIKRGNPEEYLITLEDLVKYKTRKDLFIEFKRILDETREGKRPKGIWIHGSFGVGKTMMSLALLNRFSEIGKTVVMVSVPQLITKIQTIVTGDKTENDSLNRTQNALEEADVVVFDDIGAGKMSKWFRDNFLLPVLDYRMSNNKTTFFTSNITIKSFKNTLYRHSDENEVIDLNRVIERVTMLASELELKGNNLRKK